MLLLDLLLIGSACEALTAALRKDTGLAALDMHILCVLGNYEVGYFGDVTTPSYIARQLYRSEPAVVAQLRSLEQRKLLVRHAGLGTDRRRTSYALTASGGELSADLIEALQDIDDVVVALTPRHGESGIEKLRDAFEQVHSAGLPYDPVLLAKAIPDTISPGRREYPALRLAWRLS